MEESTPKTIPSGMHGTVVEVWPKLGELEDFPGWVKCWSRVLWDP